MDICIDRRSPWDILWNHPTVADLRADNLRESGVRERANAIGQSIINLGEMSPERILEEYGDIQLARPEGLQSRSWSNLNIAKEHFELATANRAYHVYKLKESILTILTASRAVPAIIGQCASTVFAAIRSTEGRSTLTSHIQKLNHATQLIFLSTVVGLKSAALTLLIDPVVLLYRKCLRNNHQIGMLIVDPQLSFFPENTELGQEAGALPLPGNSNGEQVEGGAWRAIAQINQLQEVITQRGGTIVGCFDDHPLTHGATIPMLRTSSPTTLFGREQFPWPIHCVHQSEGWHYVPTLNTEHIRAVFGKGQRPWVDSYSAFYDNGRLYKTLLTEYLKETCGVSDLLVVGFAYGFCVGFSALDAQSEGFRTTVITDATAGTVGINVPMPGQPNQLSDANMVMHGRLQQANVRECTIAEFLAPPSSVRV